MDVPAQVARRRLHAIASPEQPEALAAFDLDAKIITYRSPLPVIAPPFAMDSLGVTSSLFFIQFDRIRGAMPPIRFVRRKRLPPPEPDIYRIEHERPCLVGSGRAL